jgi:hypothetical protein
MGQILHRSSGTASKSYPIGYFHLDIAEVRTEDGKLCLFSAIDRTSKFAVWIYYLVWMLVLDMLKLAFQRLFSARELGMAR